MSAEKLNTVRPTKDILMTEQVNFTQH